MTQLLETTLWALGPPLLAALGLTTRLRRDHHREETVRALVMTAKGDVEIDDLRGDGSRLTIRVTRG